MDINGLNDFVALAECRSFSKAAALRNITQPAFSRRVQALENAVGTYLIDRSGKDFKLTAAGDRFLVYAKNIVDMATQGVDDAKSTLTRLSEPIYITAPAYLSKAFFPAWYKAMQACIPHLTMRITQQRGSDAIESVHKGTADFALIFLAKDVTPCYNFNDLQICSVGKDNMLAVQAKHVQSAKKLLMYEQNSYMCRCAEYILGQTAQNDVVFETSSTGLLKEMALSGFGIAVLPESIIADDIKDGYLTPIPDQKPLPCDIALVRTKKKRHDKAESLWNYNQQ